MLPRQQEEVAQRLTGEGEICRTLSEEISSSARLCIRSENQEELTMSSPMTLETFDFSKWIKENKLTFARKIFKARDMDLEELMEFDDNDLRY